jgi:hypothetical protein
MKPIMVRYFLLSTSIAFIACEGRVCETISFVI